MKSLSYSSPSTAFMVAFTLMKERKKAKLYKEAAMWHVDYHAEYSSDKFNQYLQEIKGE